MLEKVDGLAAQWKDNPEATPEDSQQLADVDLFALNEGATALRVHPVWLNHLQVCCPVAFTPCGPTPSHLGDIRE